ncbi:MAG: hypothetical protein ACR2M0_11780 [Chloroflexia bacterium]
MKLLYYEDPAGNFGDDLNPWLWPRLAPDLLDGDGQTLFVGIGSILDERIPAVPLKVVFGTGIGYGRLPSIDESWKIYCVRGPLTAQALGLPADLALTDPAALVSAVVRPDVPKLHAVSLMPHFRTSGRAKGQGVDLETVCNDLGVNYINPSGGVEATIFGLQSSNLVIAEAMHGAIVADALRVPWVPVQIYDQISSLKWWDWCKSLGLEYVPTVYSAAQADPASELAGFMRSVMAHARPVLSNEAGSAAAIERLEEKLDRLRRDRGGGGFTGSTKLVQDPEVLRGIPWLYDIQSAIREIVTVIPVGESFILVDDMQWGGGRIVAGRTAIPFTEREGQYWGPPSDSATAIRELERLRQSGAGFIVFAWSSFWWLDYYAEFNDYLRSVYKCILETDQLVMFSISSQAS